MRIIFMGTPDFAVPSLEILCDNGYQVVAVVTSPDRPAGRGLQMNVSPVKQFALSRQIPVLQPEKLRSVDFLEKLQQYKADLQVVVAFRMLPELVWAMPPLGTINLHASLLPDYRGAAPINHAIMQGETVTGLTTFFLQQAIDTGDILLQKSIPITASDTAGSLHDTLMHEGAALVLETVEGILNQTVHPQPQSSESGKIAPKIFKEDCQINWKQPVKTIQNFIRGLSPYPCAWTLLKEKTLKVYSVHVELDTLKLTPGAMETDGHSYLKFRGADGWIFLDDIQWQGKKRMETPAFLRGFRP